MGVASHVFRIVSEFEAVTKREPLIPTGASLDHVPALLP
jgi:hypothetical protein